MKLKECPFCGGEPRRFDGPTGSYHTAAVECSRCAAGFSYSSETRTAALAVVTRRWQRRDAARGGGR